MSGQQVRSVEAAVEEFSQKTFQTAQESDEFFSRHIVGSHSDRMDAPFERHLWNERLLIRLQDSDNLKYSGMHKGTPLFFLAWTAFEMRNFEKAFFYLDASFSEDIKHLPDWLTAPGARFLKLDGTNHVAGRTIHLLRQQLDEEFQRFNAISGHKPITMTDWISHFAEPLMTGENAEGRTVLAALYVFVFEYRDRAIELALRADADGANHSVLSNLFLGGLVFESLLKRHYSGHSTLGGIFKDPAFLADFELSSKPSTSAKLLSAIKRDIKSNDSHTAFTATARLRNTAGHNLERDNVFTNPEAYSILYQQVVDALLYVVANKWLP